MIIPKKMGADEFSMTFGARMVRINPLARLPCDIWPYFDQISDGDFEGYDCSERAVDYIWEDDTGTFQHILLRSRDPDVFLVVVVDLRHASVAGHRLLNLKKEYGLENPD